MLSLADAGAMTRALNALLPAALTQLLEKHVRHTLKEGLASITHLIVLFALDPETALIEEIGMSPLLNPTTGAHYGDTGFTPWHDWLQASEVGWYEAIFCIGDTGYAVILLIQERADELGAFCREFSCSDAGTGSE